MAMVGRKRELYRLNSLYGSRQDVFLLMTGRKSIGKTTLLRAFCEGKDPLFFTCANVSDALNRAAFGSQLNQYIRDEVVDQSRSTPSWKEMLADFAEFPERKRKVLIIDNFDFLVQGNCDILSIFKNIWHNLLCPNGVMVVLAFHDGQLQGRLKSEGKGFFAAVTHYMKLEAISFIEMMREYPHYDFNQLIMLYSLTGGVPRYFTYFQTCLERKDFFDEISHYTMNPCGDLFAEPANLLEYDIGNVSGYHSVMMAMACGRYTLPDISGFCGLKESRVDEILEQLTALNYVVKRVSILEKHIGRKTIRYYFKDAFFFFWYTFVFPYFEQIKDGRDQEAAAFLSEHFNDYVRQWFRQAAIAMFKSAGRSGNILLQCPQVGTFYNRDAEVDVVGIDPDRKELFLGECCYEDGVYDQARFDAFREKCEGLREFRQFKDYERTYGVFSNLSFDKKLIDYAQLNKGVLLFDKITIYSLNS